MYAFLRGTLIENNPTYAVLDVQGIGYKIFIPPNALSLPLNQTCTLYTSLIIRENAHTLYGFIEDNSRDLFELLIGISGVGPKTALCLLSKFTPNSLQQAVHEQNVALIATVPGIGKKTAERLVFDIRDKLGKICLSTSSIPLNASQHKIQDALQALINLGFSQVHAKKAVEKVIQEGSDTLELSEIITNALRHS